MTKSEKKAKEERENISEERMKKYWNEMRKRCGGK